MDTKSKTITIIGAGLGGLTAGALLAKNGYKVTLLEQHNIVGGCATTFKRKGGFICEVGLHEMDGVYTNPQIKAIFDELGVYKSVAFVKPDEFFAVTTQSGTFIMPDGVEKAKKKLTEKFPHELQGINKYFERIAATSKELFKLQNASWYHYALFPFIFPNILRYRAKSVTEVLDKIINDSKLKLILNANVQYYNDTPDTLSFIMHSVAQYSYYSGGGWFMKGGSQTLSDHLAKVITESGGNVYTGANVIACDSNHVRYRYKKEEHSLKSDMIVSNLSPLQTYELFGVPYKENKEIANSILTLYLGFSQNIKSVYGTRAYSNFFFDNIDSIDGYNKMLKEDITKRGFVFVDYSQIDSALTKESNKSFAVATWGDYIEEWESLSPDEYQKKKETLIRSTLEKLEKHYPGIGELVEYAEVGTPTTVQHYIKTPKGTAYGYKASPKQFFKIAKVKSKKVKNLYFVGQWVIAGGFSPSIMSGQMCYLKIREDS